MPMTVADLLEALQKSPLTDLYIPGYIDDGVGSATGKYLPPDSRQFHPMTDDVYLEFGAHLVRCRSSAQHSKMTAESVDRIECAFAIDPDDTFGVTSVLRLTLQSGRDAANAVRLDVFANEGLTLDLCSFAALGLAMDNGDYIFLDPRDTNGIHLGAAPARDLWISHWGDRYSRKEFAVGGS